jgi:hypothetical protein
LQQVIARLFARLMKSKSWVLLILLSIAIKWVSLYPEWVERNYSRGIYPVISKLQRIIFGWVPFSIGDAFYGFLVIVILYKLFQLFRLIFKRKLNRKYFIVGLQQMIFFFLFLYVTFNLFWGLNYNRKGIAKQLGLQVKQFTLADLDTLANVMQNRVNSYAMLVTEQDRDSFNKKSRLFKESVQAFKELGNQYSFFKYSVRSVKPSFYSYLGNYLGFQGYYNPWSGEANVNTTVPRFLEPYVTTHEIAHQLGYAKENEANFVAFLACKNYNNTFRYSVYYDMFNYTIGEIYRQDTALARSYMEKAHPQFLADQKEFRDFYKRYKNPIAPVIMWGYGEFLKANNQPAGKRSYNEVVIWLIAYYKKFGTEAL